MWFQLAVCCRMLQGVAGCCRVLQVQFVSIKHVDAASHVRDDPIHTLHQPLPTVCVCERELVCVFVCEYVCNRERERERECVRVTSEKIKFTHSTSTCPMCVCGGERSSVVVCMCVYA